MVKLRFSDGCSYSGEGVLLLVQSGFFPTGALIRGGALISAVRVFPTGALIRGGALNRIPRVKHTQ